MHDNSYEPLLINHATTIESVLSLVKNGCGITILPGGSDPDPKKIIFGQFRSGIPLL